ncbi:MAG: tetratricopeptide repeat protein [Prevotella sp.]|nr:tetratricopeptide repeat protein [Prevotella sp.]
MRYIVNILILLLIAVGASSQNDRSYIRSGNRDMRGGAEGAAGKAETKYRKALTANGANAQAMYNLGCALLAQNKDSMAMEMFEKSVKAEKSAHRKAMAYHNMGVIMQRQQQYGAAMEQYKNALRLAPHSEDSRYNYVLCKRLKKEDDNNNGGGGGNNNQQNQDKNKDKNKDKNQNQDKDKQDQKDEQQKQDEQQQMSKENADQLLNAAVQNEKATRERMRKAASQPSRRNLEKNW